MNFILNSILVSIVLVKCNGEVSLSDDPSLYPGHLEPLGSKRPQGKVTMLEEFPDPQDFFTNYVDKSVPLLIRGGAISSPAFKLWEDDYLKSHKESETTQVFVENRKKENRTKGGYNIPLKKFIERYKKDDIYMVNGVPEHLQKDLRLPAPLRCESTRKMLVDTVTWFSSGGTKSVLHNDDVDNINCLLRGKKQLLFIDYNKYKSKVNIDKPEGGYSDMDVDKLDFVKYPGMREVEYINATMEEGDCLFIPYKWFHQVNSWSNDNGMNVAVNVWFQHKLNHQPKDCRLSPEEATLDKYKFSDLERQKKESSEGPVEEENQIANFEAYLDDTKDKSLTFEDFVEKIKRDGALTKADISSQPTLETFSEVVRPLFDILDADKNSKLETADFDEMEKSGNEELDTEISRLTASVEDYCEDLIEAINKGLSTDDFEASLKEPKLGGDKSAENDEEENAATKDEL
ncbi:uncharacterized protein LOC135685618 isoform X2 [Rhopilema esculentum]|uniref:uncharacterized protein LOC135685618 isoform X2 n=1 Tax=Rhopilema esculentum TaxID=499914 RepID=UPI0031CFAD9E